MEELSDYDPDLFIIYSGHNEFLEQRTYDKVLRTPEFVRDLGSLASRLRVYSALYDVSYESGAVLPAQVKAVLDRSVGPDDYHRDDEMREAVLDHFRISLTLMTHISARAQAASILVTPASNLGDFSPFKSEPDPMLGPYAIGQVDSLKTEATAALNQDDPALGLDGRNADLETAIRLDKTQVDAHYDLGVVLGALGEGKQAEALYRTTLALDPTHADAHNNLGIVLAKRGDFAGASAHFSEAVRIDPGNKKAAANLARATGRR